MMRKEDVASMRIDYKMPVFDESSFVAKEPFMQFDAWFKEAKTVEGIGEVNAMVLTTCGRLVVMCKERKKRGRSSVNYTKLISAQDFLMRKRETCLLINRMKHEFSHF